MNVVNFSIIIVIAIIIGWYELKNEVYEYNKSDKKILLISLVLTMGIYIYYGWDLKHFNPIEYLIYINNQIIKIYENMLI